MQIFFHQLQNNLNGHMFDKTRVLPPLNQSSSVVTRYCTSDVSPVAVWLLLVPAVSSLDVTKHCWFSNFRSSVSNIFKIYLRIKSTPRRSVPLSWTLPMLLWLCSLMTASFHFSKWLPRCLKCFILFQLKRR